MPGTPPLQILNKYRHYLLAVLLVLVGAAALARFLGPASRGEQHNLPLQSLIIATNADYVGTCPVVIAHHKGYFKEAGINTTIQPYKTGKASLEAALGGTADLATTADIPIMLAAMNDVPVSVVATFFKTDRDHGIVARRDRGVQSLADLKGKKIGVTVGTSGHFALNAYLNRLHLSPADVTLRNLKPDEFADAMASGDIDAIATWEPFLDNLATQLGKNGAVFFGEDIYEITYNMAGRRDFVARNPELMKKMLRALARGVDHCKSAPEASRAIMAANIRVDTSKWQSQWPNFHFQLVLDQGLILALEDESGWAMTNKLVPQRATPNFLDYMYLDAMLAVAPAGVTIIH